MFNYYAYPCIELCCKLSTDACDFSHQIHGQYLQWVGCCELATNPLEILAVNTHGNQTVNNWSRLSQNLMGGRALA